MISFGSIKSLVMMLAGCLVVVAAQLPEDMQRELNQNLAEQARIQRMREHQQRLAASRQAKPQQGVGLPVASSGQPRTSGSPAAPHDPNNYSFQQVSPPIQYSYYQPYGDAGASQQPAAVGGSQTSKENQTPNFDFNNLSLDLPEPQAQVSPRSSSSGAVPMSPSFTGAGGLPVMQPVAAAQVSPQAPGQVQQGPPLTEADFRDITGAENYGAPGGNQDFGLGGAGIQQRQDNMDGQLREFGLEDTSSKQSRGAQQSANNPMAGSMGDFDSFGGQFGGIPSNGRSSNGGGDADFGNLAGMMNEGGAAPRQRNQPNEFDFAIQPSSSEQGNQRAASEAAPGSLQSLLGAGFPGLGQDTAPAQGEAREGGHDGSSGIADDLGDRSDQFPDSNLGLGGGGDFNQQPGGQDQDFNYAAATNQQPVSVPYPDAAPQPVGTLWAVIQPQSLTQTRYNALPDKGTYQDYPAYQVEHSGSISEVTRVVDETPSARAPGPGRYGVPSPSQLAPENRPIAGRQYDYSNAPTFQ